MWLWWCASTSVFAWGENIRQPPTFLLFLLFLQHSYNSVATSLAPNFTLVGHFSFFHISNFGKFQTWRIFARPPPLFFPKGWVVVLIWSKLHFDGQEAGNCFTNSQPSAGFFAFLSMEYFPHITGSSYHHQQTKSVCEQLYSSFFMIIVNVMVTVPKMFGCLLIFIVRRNLWVFLRYLPYFGRIFCKMSPIFLVGYSVRYLQFFSRIFRKISPICWARVFC